MNREGGFSMVRSWKPVNCILKELSLSPALVVVAAVAVSKSKT